MSRGQWTSAEIARAVRLRRLVIWRVGYEQWQLLLEKCETQPGIYEATSYRGAPAIVADGSLFLPGR